MPENEGRMMLFNSYVFIFCFLPITWIIFFLLAPAGNRLAAAWLVLASLAFYGWWNPAYLFLLLASISVNHMIGRRLVETRVSSNPRSRQALIWLGVLANLAVLGYYKYANFFVANLNSVLGLNTTLETIILPLGISFFTFTQIAFLVDAYKGEIERCDLLHYSLFVTYFPHLIAGPILHHKEMIPQFAGTTMYRVSPGLIAVGLTVFAIGLFKKSVLADGVAQYVPILFMASERGDALTFLEAWMGMFAYTMQLYFDFSGYSDMAIGASLLFGVALPLNFHSPYKSLNIAEFWRRWHMTLSRFLRSYVYAPLSRSCRGGPCLNACLFVTMLVAGIWHGAGWNFFIFGALHGIYLIMNHAWRVFRRRILKQNLSRSSRWGRVFSCITTFIAVVVSLVYFRSESSAGAMVILKGMVGLNGWALPDGGFWDLGLLSPLLHAMHVPFTALSARAILDPDAILWVVLLFAIAFGLPNTQQIVGHFQPMLNAFSGDRFRVPDWMRWKPNPAFALFTGGVFVFGLVSITKVSPFLYFQF